MKTLAELAQVVQAHGRYGDTELVHLNPVEVEALRRLSPTGELTTNPDTGLKEAFLPMLAPLLGSVFGPALFAKLGLASMAPWMASALGAGGATLLTGGSGKDALKNAALGGLSGALMAPKAAAAAKAGAGAANAATAATGAAASGLAAPATEGLGALMEPTRAAITSAATPAAKPGMLASLKSAMLKPAVALPAGLALGVMAGSGGGSGPSMLPAVAPDISKAKPKRRTQLPVDFTKYGSTREADFFDEEEIAPTRMLAQGGIVDEMPMLTNRGITRAIEGEGDGMSDSVPAESGGARYQLSRGEYVIPADVVAALGNGSSEAGVETLEDMIARIRSMAHGKETQQRPVDPAKALAA